MNAGTDRNSLLLAGLPASGKTTFLAALWHVVHSREIESSMQLGQHFDGPRAYIMGRHQEWLGYTKVRHTRVTESVEKIQLSLEDPKSGEAVRLLIPDIGGETYSTQLMHRRYTHEFWLLARNRPANLT